MKKVHDSLLKLTLDTTAAFLDMKKLCLILINVKNVLFFEFSFTNTSLWTSFIVQKKGIWHAAKKSSLLKALLKIVQMKWKLKEDSFSNFSNPLK
jgi:hypothetical protein